MSSFAQLLSDRRSGLILYGLTPPKAKNTNASIHKISERRKERLASVNVDGVVLYDIQDESSRTDDNRPFPFLPTVEPTKYYEEYFKLDLPMVLYQSVGNYELDTLQARVTQHRKNAFVFVGSPSHDSQPKTTLENAYRKLDLAGVTLGGVTIPERHAAKKNEFERIQRKMAHGCSFFISQCVYDAGQFKDLLSDLYYSCTEKELQLPMMIMTVSPCGSQKTVDLFKWLGVKIPKWIENDIIRSVDTLNRSVEHAVDIVEEVLEFAVEKQIPFGCNIESVSVRKEEVLASFELVDRIEQLFVKAGIR